ncbi:hypothetical protein Pint_27951 [Pistacia integerrima]|uniref:Uncharacterized protein n=1 Tax=Pistacia integerrima TaxID=434235 RepID=A0ACC0YMV5_9ROSI|nr:hypothetical protein Pint_27951 [Pistacia integerrima]
MGMIMSFMGKGMPSAQLLNLLIGTLYKQFMDKRIDNFDDFHIAILDIFNTVNSALPGKHYDVPSRKEVEECFANWKESPESERKKKFVEFMKDKVKVNKLDDYTVIAGILTPPAAMAAKKAGENVPQLKMIKAVPDVLFVPSVTVLALMSAKLSRKMFMGKLGNSTS